MNNGSTDIIKLPPPRTESEVSVEKALLLRRSVRDYTDDPLSLFQLSQLLWAAQGITGPGELRAAPSAGATYPLEVYVIAGRVTGLSSGIFKYRPHSHDMARVREGNVMREIAEASMGQRCVEEAPAVIAFAAVHQRTTGVYGRRGIRYVDNEIGHAAQNVCLQAVALGLGTVAVGAFDDEAVRKALELGAEERVLYLVPVGRTVTQASHTMTPGEKT
jgi:SagB-type dehydrogenase family enzyme